MNKEVIIYTLPTCPWCDKLKEFLKKNKIDYKELNIGDKEEGDKYRDEMLEKTNQLSVPVTVIKKESEEGETTEKIITGFDKDQLNEALKD